MIRDESRCYRSPCRSTHVRSPAVVRIASDQTVTDSLARTPIRGTDFSPQTDSRPCMNTRRQSAPWQHPPAPDMRTSFLFYRRTNPENRSDCMSRIWYCTEPKFQSPKFQCSNLGRETTQGTKAEVAYALSCQDTYEAPPWSELPATRRVPDPYVSCHSEVSVSPIQGDTGSQESSRGWLGEKDGRRDV